MGIARHEELDGGQWGVGGARAGWPDDSEERNARPCLHDDALRPNDGLAMPAIRSYPVIDGASLDVSGLFNAQYMTRMARIALMPPKAMRCRPSETL